MASQPVKIGVFTESHHVDVLILIKALVLGIVEGLTEFLPVSSTGHLILAGDLLGFNDERGKLFEIVIQSGAILAVCWEYRAKIIEVLVGLTHQRSAQRFALNISVAFLPLAILGLLLAGGLISVVRQGAAGFAQLQQMGITPGFAMLCLGFAVAIGVLSSLVPATNASRTNILDALRNAGLPPRITQ